MAWFGWAAGLVSGLWAAPPPGSSEAELEEDRLSALLNKQLHKPRGERDEELVHTLRVTYRKRQLENTQFQADIYARLASMFGQPGTLECCAATNWVRQRLAASCLAVNDYHCQHIQQVAEELAAAEARRPPALLVQPTLRLALPEALQQPSRLDMCSKCAERIQNVELFELQIIEHARHLQKQHQARGLRPPTATTAAAPHLSTAAAVPPAGEGPQVWQQQGRGGSDNSGGKHDAPATPTQQQQRQQQQEHEHATLDEEQTQQEGHVG